MLQSLYNKMIEATSYVMSNEPISQETEQPTTTNQTHDTQITTEIASSQLPIAAATTATTTTTAATATATSAAASAASQPVVRPPPHPPQTPETIAFLEAYDCAKLNNNWAKVSSSLTVHPDWLIRIPEGRRWTMLHQIVFSGDVTHLNDVLALQISNAEFRLLCKTLDDKTVREVAAERAHIHPQMLRRIERLVATDQLLNNAKDNKWDLVKHCINLQPDLVNEKPPYRRFYLVHQLAATGNLTMFKELSTKCHFKLNVLADEKTISQIAREQSHNEFADHIESLVSQASGSSEAINANANANDDNNDDLTSSDHDGHHHFSPGFYEDPGISFIPANLDLNNLFPSSHHPTFPVLTNQGHYIVTHSLYHGPYPGTMSTTNFEHGTIDETEDDFHEQLTPVEATPAPVQAKPTVPLMTDEEQAAYEEKIKVNAQKMSHQNLLNSITCCITKNILHDPVVAADGFTYERAAILDWFNHSTRSPMTNEELENLELKPNYAIKSILQLLQDNNNNSAPTTGSKSTASSQ